MQTKSFGALIGGLGLLLFWAMLDALPSVITYGFPVEAFLIGALVLMAVGIVGLAMQ